METFLKIYAAVCFIAAAIGSAISLAFIGIGFAAIPFIFGFLK